MESQIKELVTYVESAFELKAGETSKKSKKREVCDARAIAFKVLRDAGMSLTEIGKTFNRDHTTVLSSLQMIESIMAVTPKYQRLYEEATAAYIGKVSEESINEEFIKRWREPLANLAQVAGLLGTTEMKISQIDVTYNGTKVHMKNIVINIESRKDALQEVRL